MRARMRPSAPARGHRAPAAGAGRADVDPTDLVITQLMVGAVLDASRDVAPDLWRRYLGVVLRGIATRPDDLDPLGVTALDPDDVDRVMSVYRRTRPKPRL